MISSSIQTSIRLFIESKKKQGFSPASIKKQLILHGYTESEISSAFGDDHVQADSNILKIIHFIKDQRLKKRVDSQIRTTLKKEGYTASDIKQAFLIANMSPVTETVQKYSKNLSSEVSKSQQLLKRIHQNERDALMHKIKTKLAGKRHFFSGLDPSKKTTKEIAEEDSQAEKMRKALEDALAKNESSETRLNELQSLVSNMSTSMASEILGQLEQTQAAQSKLLPQTEQQVRSAQKQEPTQQAHYSIESIPPVVEEPKQEKPEEFVVDQKQNKEVIKLSSEYKNPRLQQATKPSSSGGEAFGFYNPIVADKIEFAEEPIGDRAQTGIPDLDLVIDGGFVRNSVTLVSGGAGTGKSTFALQYIINGIVLNNEPGVYVTFEQTRDAIIQLGTQFGWDIENLEKQNMLTIHEYSPEQIYKAVKSGGGSFRDLIDSISAKRVVVDSITEYVMMFESDMAKRREITDFFKTLTKWGTTVLVVGEEESTQFSHRSTVLDYETDGVILLYNERKGDIRQRALEIFKMRGTKHAGRIFPMKITSTGVLVNVKSGQIYRG